MTIEMKSLKLLHLANHNSTNIGNGALILGAERVLRKDLGQEINFMREPWDDYTFGLKNFDGTFVDLINHESDGLVVGAAVTLDGRAKFTHAGMRFNLPYELWSKISKPIVFYSISYRFWPYQPYHNLDQLKQAMVYILNSPKILFSVRNDGSKAWLESLLGYSSDKIVTIPDPALYVPNTDAWHPELADGKVNILISLNNEDAMYRFGGRLREHAWRYLSPLGEQWLLNVWKYVPGWREKKRQFLRRLAAALEKLSKDREVNFILCPHYFEDYRMMEDFVSFCSPRLAHQLLVSCGIPRLAQTPYFYDLYAQADVALSMRVHSMTPALGVGTPLVALVSQPRMAEFMTDAELQDFAVDIFDADLTERLYGLVTYLFQHRDKVRRKMKEARSNMRERTLAYNQRVASLIVS